jgi:hypothetical protein
MAPGSMAEKAIVPGPLSSPSDMSPTAAGIRARANGSMIAGARVQKTSASSASAAGALQLMETSSEPPRLFSPSLWRGSLSTSTMRSVSNGTLALARRRAMRRWMRRRHIVRRGEKSGALDNMDRG